MRDVRADFPVLQRTPGGRRLVYLDNAATTLKPQTVIDAVTRYYTHYTAGVHRAVHLLAEEATEAFEGARGTIARFFHADEDEIVFTRGATEAINLVKNACPGLKRVVTTAIEHHSNFLPWAYQPETRIMMPFPDGQLDLTQLDSLLKVGVDLVAIGHVSNVSGAILPIEEIIKKAHAAGAMVLVDAAQSAPHMSLNVKELDVDFLVCSGHKMLAPGGVGLLYGKREHFQRMSPYQLGGNIVESVRLDGYTLQAPPAKFEAGTPPTEAVIGWGTAADYLSQLGMADVEQHSRTLAGEAYRRLRQIENVRVVGPEDDTCRSTVVSFYLPGLESHAVARMLSQRANVLVRSGFHCAEPLHESLQLPPTVRASFYLYNTQEDVDLLAETVTSVASLVAT